MGSLTLPPDPYVASASDWLFLGMGSDGNEIWRNRRTGEIQRRPVGGSGRPAAPMASPQQPRPQGGGGIPFPTMPTMPSPPSAPVAPAPETPQIPDLGNASTAALMPDLGSGAGANEKGMGGLRASLGNRIHPSLEKLVRARMY